MIYNGGRIKSSCIGNAAEAFMVFRLSLWGYQISKGAEGSHYDLVCDAGDRLYRIQVKGSNSLSYNSKRTSASYKFNASKGRSTNIPYGVNDFDILAMVALPKRRCLFTLPNIKKLSYSKHGSLFTKKNELQTWEDCLEKLTGLP